MSILFNDIVFGPIKSRRFGVSLGINLLPLVHKVCNFNCIYCECGWTELKQSKVVYFSFEKIINSIKNRFEALSQQNIKIDSITLAGNGEPTMHPDFSKIMETIIDLRSKYLPDVEITILSNSTLLSNKKVVNALLLADKRVMKLDAGSNELLSAINIPLSKRDIRWYIEKLKSFNGNVIIQTIFLKGNYNGQFIDNTSSKEVNLWIKALNEIKPKEVMIYTVDREAPVKELEKVSTEKLNEICELVNKQGIKANVYL